jgi:hypothetical protein
MKGLGNVFVLCFLFAIRSLSFHHFLTSYKSVMGHADAQKLSSDCLLFLIIYLLWSVHLVDV